MPLTLENQLAHVQLRLIAEITNTLQQNDIQHWLLGGWGLDILVGRLTRLHEDLDFFIWTKDIDKVLKLLNEIGFVLHPEASGGYLDESMFIKKDNHWVELILIEENQKGEITTPGRFTEWPWLKEAFGNELTTFLNVSVPVYGAAGHLYIKKGFSQHGDKDPLREKDYQDLALLKELLGDIDFPEAEKKS